MTDSIEIINIYAEAIPIGAINSRLISRIEDPDTFLEDERKYLELLMTEKGIDTSTLSPPWGIWKEVVLGLGLEEKASFGSIDFYNNLNLKPMSSYRATLTRKLGNNPGIDMGLNQVGIQIYPETSDNYFPIGYRGGNVQSGMFMPVGGSVIQPINGAVRSENPIWYGVMDELLEELGIKSIDALNLIGTYFSEGFQSYNLVFHGHVDLTLKQIREIHQDTYSIYRAAKDAKIPEIEARRKIADRANKDAWEHVDIAGIPYGEISRWLVSNCTFSPDQKNIDKMSGVGRASLAVLMGSLYGQSLIPEYLMR